MCKFKVSRSPAPPLRTHSAKYIYLYLYRARYKYLPELRKMQTKNPETKVSGFQVVPPEAQLFVLPYISLHVYNHFTVRKFFAFGVVWTYKNRKNLEHILERGSLLFCLYAVERGTHDAIQPTADRREAAGP